jgi:signal transduction histidine kinase
MRVGESIQTQHRHIIEDWAAQARRAAAARGLSRPELQNMMPRFLSWLAESDGGAPEQGRELVANHLSSRLRQGFNLSEIVEEFALLGRCIAGVWASAPVEEQPKPEDIARLFSSLQDATSAVIDMFTRHLFEDEQTEKRYLRELQKIATEGLSETGPSLRSQLCAVLDLVREAMGAASAALMLYEPKTHNLVTTATVGPAEEELERYITSVGSASFAASVAENDVKAIADAQTTALEVSDTLRSSGIHALLGVRLPERKRLLGVLYVGVREQRPFTSREIRRIEVLGGALTIHLDNAKLFADLRDNVAALEAERELREQFVSVLAHDLRGPLAAAGLAAQQLARHSAAESGGPALALRIQRNIERTDKMIRDLLDVHRLRAGGRIPLRIAPCELVAICRHVIDDLAGQHGDRFVLESEGEVRGFWAPDELQRAIWNLGSNALKYGAPDSPITLRIDRADDHAELSVHNAGRPIPPSERARLFDPFIRGGSTQAGEPGGWGLGLTLVRGCAEAHGGEVSVTSSEAEGTTFTMTLPLDSRPWQTQAEPETIANVGNSPVM